MSLLYQKTKLRGPMFRGGYEGGGTDLGGDFGSEAPDGTLGQSAPGPNGSPGVPSAPAAPAPEAATPAPALTYGTGLETGYTGSGLSLGGGSLGLTASAGAGLSLAAPSAGIGLQVSDSMIGSFGPELGSELERSAAAVAAHVALASAAATTASAAARAKAEAEAKQLAALKATVALVPGGSLVMGVFNTGKAIFEGIASLFTGESTSTSTAPGAALATSTAPSLTGTEATGADLASNGFSGGEVDTISGSPVLGFGGVTVNQSGPNQTIPTSPVWGGDGGGTVAPGPSLAELLSGWLAPYPQGRYAAPGAPAQQTQSIAPLVVLAGIASLLYLG